MIYCSSDTAVLRPEGWMNTDHIVFISEIQQKESLHHCTHLYEWINPRIYLNVIYTFTFIIALFLYIVNLPLTIFVQLTSAWHLFPVPLLLLYQHVFSFKKIYIYFVSKCLIVDVVWCADYRATLVILSYMNTILLDFTIISWYQVCVDMGGVFFCHRPIDIMSFQILEKK